MNANVKNNSSMRKQIEQAIKTTLVVENKESIHYAVDKILRLLDVSKSDGIEREASCNHSEWTDLYYSSGDYYGRYCNDCGEFFE